jgi:hypothetical protein
MMQLPPLTDLVLFMGLTLAFALSGLTVSGHFPAEHRGQALLKGAHWVCRLKPDLPRLYNRAPLLYAFL